MSVVAGEKVEKRYKAGRRGGYILDRAMEHLNSVPYKPSSRWVFYRLLQDGYYHTKDDYARWTQLCSRARKGFYAGWNPDTLADDTRDRIARVGFYKDRAQVKHTIVDQVVQDLEITFDHFYDQSQYVIIAFEARAMVEQFIYHTRGIDLLPFGGDASIPFKWHIAKHLENCHEWYGIPITILYFGDYDEKGNKIFEGAMKDVEAWCGFDFEYFWCGLTEGQAERYRLPENPEKPGQYQWEALTDEQAKEIIHVAMDAFVDQKLIETKREESERVTKEWRKKIRVAITPLVETRRGTGDQKGSRRKCRGNLG